MNNDMLGRSLEQFLRDRVFKVSLLFLHILPDLYNGSYVSVPCDKLVVKREKGDNPTKDYNRPTGRRADFNTYHELGLF